MDEKKRLNTEFLSVRQVAKRYNVAVSTIHEWLKKRLIPHIRVDGIIRIKQKDLENFEGKHYVKAKRRQPF